MASLSEEDTLSHRGHEPLHGHGKPFSYPWVGDYPTSSRRRAYMVAYFRHMLVCTNFEGVYQEVRRISERVASKGLIASGWTQVPVGLFEYEVDRATWMRFFSPFEKSPVWPWTRHPDLVAGLGESYSGVFKEWSQKILKAKESEEAAGPVKSVWAGRLRSWWR